MNSDLSTKTKEELIEEVKKLRGAIREHRDCSGHDLCWYHPEMWKLLPEAKEQSFVVPEWPQFMQGCLRYRTSLDEQAPDAPRTSKSFEKK